MKKRILIIDDNLKDNTEYFCVLWNVHEVDVVGYISSARIKLKQPDRYDLAVIDIMMPTMEERFDNTQDGLRTGLAYYETELREMNIPVLFWSWNNEFKDEIEIKTKNKEWIKTGFLLKTTDHDHLLKGVEDFCEKFNL